ncbi:MAG: hypothetical protein Q9169_006507 [Polycauliona sp. 2 TL-2023]
MERLDTPLAPRADAARERELYRYFDPPHLEAAAPSLSARQNLSVEHDDPLTAKPPSSPENTLTALAQLCALRLDASRAMVSVIAQDTQYFIAEATKTMDLVENNKSEADGDTLWVGCGSVGKQGRLCERTIELPADTTTYPCFTVTDLSNDTRFNQLPFVTGDPHFKFYAGTPLTTKNGVNIGSLFILDTKVRPRLNPTQERFLGTIAATIMGHLEVNREAEERNKVLHMAKGLNAFVEGKGTFNIERRSGDKTKTVPTDGAVDEIERTHTNIEGAHKATFARAASLLSDSLKVREHGGVAFLDTTTGPRHVSLRRSATIETESESETKDSPRKSGVAKRRTNSSHANDRHTGDLKEHKRAEVIAWSGSEPETLPSEASRDSKKFTPLDEPFLQSLLKHYPRGKAWIFDGVEGLTSEDDDRRLSGSSASEEQVQRRLSRKISEKDTLRRCFPNGGSLAFSRWTSQILASLMTQRSVILANV